MADFSKHTLAQWHELAARELESDDTDLLMWQTPEGIEVKPLYTAADLEELFRSRFFAGLRALRARSARHHVRRPPLDGAPIRWLLYR